MAEAGAPPVPTAGVVQLFESPRENPAPILHSTPRSHFFTDATGAWEFDELDENARYSVVAYDLSGEYDPVVKINLIPSPPED